MNDRSFTGLKNEDNAFLLNDAKSSLKSYYQAYASVCVLTCNNYELHCVSNLQ